MNVTLTWVPASGQNATSDPAPPAVWVCESAQSEWTNGTSGSADDALGETKSGTGYYGSAATSDAPASVPPAHWSSRPVSGGGQVIMPPRTFSAEGDAPVTLNSPYGNSCGSYIDFYTITIHAQPYGLFDAGHLENGVFVAGPHADNTTGELAFSYGWYSTSGQLGDLNGITIYEVLDYSGTPGTMSSDNKTFYPQSPPITSGYAVPNGKAGTPFNATTWYAHDVHSAFPTVNPLQPLSPLTWTVPQKYEFDDPATGEVGTVLKDMGNIVDRLQINPNKFTVSKSGATATKPL